MKRYLVFAFDLTYPRGGWNDLIGQADTFVEAKNIMIESYKKRKHSKYQIVNLATNEVYEYYPEEVAEMAGEIKHVPVTPAGAGYGIWREMPRWMVHFRRRYY